MNQMHLSEFFNPAPLIIFRRQNDNFERHLKNISAVDFRYLRQLLDYCKLRIVIVVNIKKVKDGIEGITEVSLHAEAFFDFMKVDYRLVYVYFGVDPVMQIFGCALGVALEKSGFA